VSSSNKSGDIEKSLILSPYILNGSKKQKSFLKLLHMSKDKNILYYYILKINANILQ